MPGPLPKDPATRRRTNKESRQQIPNESCNAVVAPPLLFGDWSEAVHRYWAVWSTCPQAVMFTTTDWNRLQQLLPIVQRYWANPNERLMAEIRQNESLLGATVADRMRLRWDITRTDDPKEATPANQWRDRLEVVDDAVGGA